MCEIYDACAEAEAGPSASGSGSSHGSGGDAGSHHRGRRRSVRFTPSSGPSSGEVGPVAGPSRLRGGSAADPMSSADAPSTTASTPRKSNHNSRPASPTTAFSSTLPNASHPDSPSGTAPPPPPHPAPHLDLPTYPTPTLLKLLASLLHQIATANDALRPELDDNAIEVDGAGAEEDPPPGSTGAGGGTSSRGVTPASATEDSGSARGSATSSRQMHPSPTTALFTEAPDPAPPPADPMMNTDQYPLFTASRTSLHHPSSLLSFHARHIPSITIEAYLLRILKYCPTTNEVFLGLLVYFDRMSRLGTASGVGGVTAASKGRGFAIDSFNVHRLVIAGVTVASKFFSDVFYTNSRYAKVGGLPPHELNQLELQFLLLNDFRLAIPPEEMQRYGDRLLAYWEGREGEIGIDVATGRELSERSKARAEANRRDSPRRSSQPQQTQTAATAPPPAAAPAESTAAQVEVKDAMDVDPPACTPAPPPSAPPTAEGLPSQPATGHATPSAPPGHIVPPTPTMSAPPPPTAASAAAENGVTYAHTPTPPASAKATPSQAGRQNGLVHDHGAGVGVEAGVQVRTTS